MLCERIGDSIGEAIEAAYHAVDQISWEGDLSSGYWLARHRPLSWAHD